MKKISHKDITKWLISIDLLCEKNPYGSYTVTIYNKSAQEFNVENLSAILNFKYQ